MTTPWGGRLVARLLETVCAPAAVDTEHRRSHRDRRTGTGRRYCRGAGGGHRSRNRRTRWRWGTSERRRVTRRTRVPRTKSFYLAPARPSSNCFRTPDAAWLPWRVLWTPFDDVLWCCERCFTLWRVRSDVTIRAPIVVVIVILIYFCPSRVLWMNVWERKRPHEATGTHEFQQSYANSEDRRCRSYTSRTRASCYNDTPAVETQVTTVLY